MAKLLWKVPFMRCTHECAPLKSLPESLNTEMFRNQRSTHYKIFITKITQLKLTIKCFDCLFEIKWSKTTHNF